MDQARGWSRKAVFSDFDRFAMQRALTLAARGLETTDPNPRVGCVIAQRGRISGEGWHERAGEAHAEVRARYADDSEVLATLDDHQREYDLFRVHCDVYGYVFFVMRKPAP